MEIVSNNDNLIKFCNLHKGGVDANNLYQWTIDVGNLYKAGQLSDIEHNENGFDPWCYIAGYSETKPHFWDAINNTLNEDLARFAYIYYGFPGGLSKNLKLLTTLQAKKKLMDVKYIIGIQDVHGEKHNMIVNLFDMYTQYSWTGDNFDPQKLKECDILLLCAGWQYKYLQFKIPYILHVCNMHVIENLHKHITKYFVGILDISGNILHNKLKIFRHGIKYKRECLDVNGNFDSKNIIALIGNYKKFGANRGYEEFSMLKNKYKILEYGENCELGHIHDIDAIRDAKYLIHVKHWGHICNAVMKSLSCGVPVIMDNKTYQVGMYKNYIFHGHNAFVGTIEEIDMFLEIDDEEYFKKLKKNCLSDIHKYYIPFQKKINLEFFMNAMEYAIVVARYNEDIEWVNKDDNVIIYDKGSSFEILSGIIYRLPNIGKEPHSYLNYIIDNYNNLPDIVVFTQGFIEDHNFSGLSDLEYLHKLKKEASLHGYSQNFSKNIHNANNYNFRLPIFKNRNLFPSKYAFGKWFEISLNTKFPTDVYFYPAAIFAVSKSYILSRNINFYKKLLLNFHTKDDEVSHYFERSWMYIFNIL